MPLWSRPFSPGSMAILAASGADETPALPGKTLQEFPRYLVVYSPKGAPYRTPLRVLPLEVLQTGQEFIQRQSNHQNGEHSRGQAQRAPRIEEHRLENDQQNAYGLERADG